MASEQQRQAAAVEAERGEWRAQLAGMQEAFQQVQALAQVSPIFWASCLRRCKGQEMGWLGGEP